MTNFHKSEQFGQEIRQARERLQMNQTALAAAAGMSQSRLSLIETGRWNPSPEEIERLKAVLDRLTVTQPEAP